jgi:hypothetical protein
MSLPFTLARTNEAKTFEIKTDQELKQKFGFISDPEKNSGGISNRLSGHLTYNSS